MKRPCSPRKCKRAVGTPFRRNYCAICKQRYHPYNKTDWLDGFIVNPKHRSPSTVRPPRAQTQPIRFFIETVDRGELRTKS